MNADQHRAWVAQRIEQLRRQGMEDPIKIAARCEGADPRLVDQLLKECDVTVDHETARRARERSAQLPWELPAEDPEYGQWWFTMRAVADLAERVSLCRSAEHEASILCLGAPTIGLRLADASFKVTVADVDVEVLNCIQKMEAASLSTFVHDVSLPLPEEHRASYDIVVMDPPWYQPIFDRFIEQSVEALRTGGEAFCSLPAVLTRPTAAEERTTLVRRLSENGLEILDLERGALSYIVPRFEETAFGDLTWFSGHPWRAADLIHFRRPNLETSLAATDAVAPTTGREPFARDPREFRVFLRPQIAGKVVREACVRLEDYSRNVSRRSHSGELPDVWSTDKVGVFVASADEARLVLSEWRAGTSPDGVADRLRAARGLPPQDAKAVVQQYDEELHLWTRYGEGTPRRSRAEIKEKRDAGLSSWATPATGREHDEKPDAFRLDFQRDRDRVLWSAGLRRLAHKTQLFPVDSDDELRQRLTHSIEVMQLASTIAASFGLDSDLVEAGALAHDIGHTPFGHAGEHALHKLLTHLNGDLPGFNHYEHGVDVIRWLEGPYQSPSMGGHPGLNLTPEVAECVFKHTFCQSGSDWSHDQLRKQSKHRDFLKDGYCHLEGQAVRLADKVSYLISDLEDGIRLGAIGWENLLGKPLTDRLAAPRLPACDPRGDAAVSVRAAGGRRSAA